MIRTFARRILPTAIGLAVIAILIVVSHPTEIWKSVRVASPLALLTALALNVPVVLFRQLRAAVVLEHVGYRLPFGKMLISQLVGQTTSSVTPASSGDYVRAYLWRRLAGIPLRAGAAVVLFERVFSFGLMITLAIALITLLPFGAVGWAAIASVIAIASLAPAILERVSPELERKLLTRLTRGRRLSRFSEGALGLTEKLRQLIGSPLLLGKSSLITLVIFGFSGLQVWVLLKGLGISMSLPQAVAVYAASQVGGTISTLPFGLGSMDAVMVAILTGYGATVAVSAPVAVLLRATATLPQALAGFVAYLAFVRGTGAQKDQAEQASYGH